MIAELITVREAAKRLAVSPLTIRRWVALRRVPVVRIGRAVRIREQDLEALIAFGFQRAERLGERR